MSALNLIQSIFGANLQQHPLYRQGQPIGPQVFKRKYHAYSPAYWNSENRDKLEAGDKIVLPASALEELSRMHVQFPIMFEIAHDSDILPKKSHCSVMEFTAPEGSVYLPIWMIDNLGLDPQGDSVVELTTVSLAKGHFVQFQAHETEFAMLKNPRVVLEKNLRSYSCLTVGDTIQVEFAGHIYKLDVTEVKPSIQRGSAPPAISIIETDIKVDFKEPRDYKEWQKKNNYTANANNSNLQNNDSKMDDVEEDDFGFVPPQILAQQFKSDYFKNLEQVHGSNAQKLKKPKKSSKINANNKKSNTNGKIKKLKSMSFVSPMGNTRGAPLGKRASSTPIPENSSVNTSAKKKRNVRKEEEVIGTMRYIYEIDDCGGRKLVRRLPIRHMSEETTGHSLK